MAPTLRAEEQPGGVAELPVSGARRLALRPTRRLEWVPERPAPMRRAALAPQLPGVILVRQELRRPHADDGEPRRRRQQVQPQPLPPLPEARSLPRDGDAK
jgi:hypothetical protein